MSEERKRIGLIAPEMMNPQEGLPAFFWLGGESSSAGSTRFSWSN